MILNIILIIIASTLAAMLVFNKKEFILISYEQYKNMKETIKEQEKEINEIDRDMDLLRCELSATKDEIRELDKIKEQKDHYLKQVRELRKELKKGGK